MTKTTAIPHTFKRLFSADGEIFSVRVQGGGVYTVFRERDGTRKSCYGNSNGLWDDGAVSDDELYARTFGGTEAYNAGKVRGERL